MKKTTKAKSDIDEILNSRLPDESKKTETPDKATSSASKKATMKGEVTKMQNEEIKNIPINQLKPFENHPFKVNQDEDFQKLYNSIKENGILIPAVARPKGDSFELISGHRREFACRMLGIETMPVLIRELTDEQSVVAMVDSNVQRENILPSEKAYAYKMKLEALNKQGKRSDLTTTPVVSRLRTNEKVGQESGDSREQVRRYVRLTELIPQLLQLVDAGKIAFRPAVELSYLSKDQQELLLSAIEAEQSTPSLSQAQKLKAISAKGKLTDDSMMEVMREQKANQKEQVKIPYYKVREIIKKDMDTKELEDFILKAVADYHKRLSSRQRNNEAR